MENKNNDKMFSIFKQDKLISIASFLGLIIAVIMFGFLSDGRTVSAMNLKILMNQVVVVALVSIGAIFSFSCRAFDLSLGGALGLSAIAGALIGIQTGSVVVMIITTVVVSMLIALFKGLMAAYLDLPIFIVTIVLGSILSAVGLVLLGNKTIVSLRSLINVSNITTLNILFVGVFYISALVIFNYTKIGKSCKLMGGNETAASQSGINTKKNMIIAFLMNGLGVSLAAIILLLRTKTVTAGTGGSISLDVVVAIVLGGMPFTGGPKSKISAGIIGAATITVINNGLNVVGLSTGSIQMVRSIIFLIVAFITSMSYRGKLLPR